MAPYRTAADLRQDATRCRALADKAKDPTVRASLSRVADTYELLARQVEDLMKKRSLASAEFKVRHYRCLTVTLPADHEASAALPQRWSTATSKNEEATAAVQRILP